MDLPKICRNYDNSSVKIALPALILGGGEWRRENPRVTFLYHKIKLLARKNSLVGIPTKPLSRDDSRRISSQLADKVKQYRVAGKFRSNPSYQKKILFANTNFRVGTPKIALS
ncbi:hypothetical protein JWG45_04350 [Leptospira sp. 201903070]|uniref:Uncharacterized protein n=1 Tax=Leptospira ainlahdjerensis TaxID=2810033 RepID=A0ABS2UBS5_9LEPT|nr:hypothetical protein [Leptospira ainlahdjerensis]MBM9576380.1 hypothetical protein [Leptospira ainlahdjerensis]